MLQNFYFNWLINWLLNQWIVKKRFLEGVYQLKKDVDTNVRRPYYTLMKNLNYAKITKEELLFNRMNDGIMNVARIYMYWHDKEQDFGIEDSLCRAEIHTIKAIGDNPGGNLTNLANVLGVTKPTVSEKIKKLAKLNLVRKQASPLNNKEIMLLLTDKGWIAHQKHEENHRKLFQLFQDFFGDEAFEFLEEFEKKIGRFHDFLDETDFMKTK